MEVRRLDSLPEDMAGVEIPAQQVVYHLFNGSEDQIAAAFADMYTWALENGFAGDAFKIDRITSEAPTAHQLFIRVVQQKAS